MQNEIWKDIQGYEGLYQVSNKGRIKICKNNRSKIKKTAVNHNGYYTVTLYKNKKPKCFRVSRLVAEAFCDKPSDNLVVNHIDNDRKNNKAENLEWVTQKQNVMHSWKQGRGNTQKAIEARKEKIALLKPN